MRADRIRRLRAQLGMSQVEFAAAIQTSVGSIYRWEADETGAKIGPVHTTIIESIELAMKDNPKGDDRRIIAHNLRTGLGSLVYLALTNTNKPRKP